MEVVDNRPRYARVDNPVIDDYLPKIGCTALAVYLVLCRHADNDNRNCWPSQEKMAKHCQLTVRTIRTAVSVLEEQGLIGVKKTKSEGSAYARNVYTILPVIGKKRPNVTGNTLPVIDQATGSQFPVSEMTGNTLPQATGSQRPTNYTQEELLSTSAEPSVSAEDDFLLFGNERLVERESVAQSKKKKSASTPDPRHTPFKDKLTKFWLHLNPDFKKYQWDAGDAGQLGSFLKKWPDLTVNEFHSWLVNYRDSEGIVRSKTPKEFLPLIHKYANDPLNEYGRPIEEKPKHAQA